MGDCFPKPLSPATPCFKMQCDLVGDGTHYNGYVLMKSGGAKSLNLGPRVGVVFLPVNTVDTTD